MHHQTHTFALFLAIGIIGAFSTAAIFMIVVQLSLPPTDMAYGQRISSALSDPFVLTIATPNAALSGLFASLVMFFCLRHRRLTIALPIVFASVFVTVVLITPLSQLLGLISAHAVLVTSSVLCARMRCTFHATPSSVPSKTDGDGQ